MLEIDIINQPNDQGLIFIDNIIYYAGKMSWCENGLPLKEIDFICHKENITKENLKINYKKHNEIIFDLKDIAYQYDPWGYYNSLISISS